MWWWMGGNLLGYQFDRGLIGNIFEHMDCFVSAEIDGIESEGREGDHLGPIIHR